MPAPKNHDPLPCPNCGNPLVITKAAADKAELKKHIRRSTVHCPHCNMSVKEAIIQNFKKNFN